MARNEQIEIDLTDLPLITNDVYFPLYEDYNRYLVLMGGGASGKSHFAAEDIIFTCLDEPGHRVLVVRNVAKTLRESCYALIVHYLGVFGVKELCEIHKSDMTITFFNGSKIIFAGVDDVEKLKSIHDMTMIWIEEATELDIGDFRQLDLRLRNDLVGKHQIIISFNPVSIESWVKSEFFDMPKDNATVLVTTYHDNRFCPKATKRVMEDYKISDPYMYDVYCMARWGIVGVAVFDPQKVTERLELLRAMYNRGEHLPKIGEFIYPFIGENKIDDVSIKFMEGNAGYIKIYREPEPGRPYVLSADTAGYGEDNWTAQIIDNASGEQCAVLKIQQIDDDVYAEQLYCMGKYYNYALISVESNFTTYPIKRLEQLGYDNQFMRETEDTITHRVQKRYGVKTTPKTRPVMLAELVKVVRENVDWINDPDTLSEMLTFVRNEKGRAEAQKGKHDDLVMALAIAYYSRAQQDTFIDKNIEVEKSEVQKNKDKRMRDLKRSKNRYARLN